MAPNNYKKDHPFVWRQAESSRFRNKHPDRIPVIVEKAGKSDLPDIKRNKFLLHDDITVGQFMFVIRKNIGLTPEKAIFVIVNNILPPTGAMIAQLYEDNKDKDGFLYMVYSGENTFGSSEI